jgi:tetratricopeptide (TPR) repeat protein
MGEEPFDLELEAFRASGVCDQTIAHYQHLFNELQQSFLDQVILSDDAVIKAKQVFDWLWQEKPNRYQPKAHYKLSDVIETQLGKEDRAVGNCLGLTVLYNCFLRRVGVQAKALQLDYTFGIGPHVLSLLPGSHADIHIENIIRQGFDYKGHINNPSGTKWGDREIVADICHSLGNELFEKGELTGALRNYEMAVSLNPDYEKAHLNKAILSDKLSRNSK